MILNFIFVTLTFLVLPAFFVVTAATGATVVVVVGATVEVVVVVHSTESVVSVAQSMQVGSSGSSSQVTARTPLRQQEIAAIRMRYLDASIMISAFSIYNMSPSFIACLIYTNSQAQQKFKLFYQLLRFLRVRKLAIDADQIVD